MKRLSLLPLILLVVISTAAAQFKYTNVECPGMRVAALFGISNNGTMVGTYYTDTDPTWHALRIKNGKCIPVAPTTIVGKMASWADAVNERGDITGVYFDGDLFTSPSHGFLLDKAGVLTLLNFPTADGTWAYKINESGTVVGRWYINDAFGNLLSMHGFTWKEGLFSECMFPGSADTMVLGINSRGEHVGYWDVDWYGVVWHGYLYSKGMYSTIDVPFPDAVATITTDINEKSEIVGQFNDLNFKTYGFLKAGSDFMRFDYPGAVATGLEGINTKGQMVGWYYDADWSIHALLVEPAK